MIVLICCCKGFVFRVNCGSEYVFFVCFWMCLEVFFCGVIKGMNVVGDIVDYEYFVVESLVIGDGVVVDWGWLVGL